MLLERVRETHTYPWGGKHDALPIVRSTLSPMGSVWDPYNYFEIRLDVS